MDYVYMRIRRKAAEQRPHINVVHGAAWDESAFLYRYLRANRALPSE